MKIATLETFVVGNPPPSFGGRYFLFVKLVTDDGIVGVGEVYAATFGPHTLARMVADVFERHVLGMDPFRIESLLGKLILHGLVWSAFLVIAGVMLAMRRRMRDRDAAALPAPADRSGCPDGMGLHPRMSWRLVLRRQHGRPDCAP